MNESFVLFHFCRQLLQYSLIAILQHLKVATAAVNSSISAIARKISDENLRSFSVISKDFGRINIFAHIGILDGKVGKQIYSSLAKLFKFIPK